MGSWFPSPPIKLITELFQITVWHVSGPYQERTPLRGPRVPQKVVELPRARTSRGKLDTPTTCRIKATSDGRSVNKYLYSFTYLSISQLHQSNVKITYIFNYLFFFLKIYVSSYGNPRCSHSLNTSNKGWME